MSRKNSLENKKKRREERETRKNAFRKKILASRVNKGLTPMVANLPTFEEAEAFKSLATEAALAEKGFIVAHQEDMLWKPGDED